MDWATLIGVAGTAASGLLSMINNKNMEAKEEAEAARKQAYYARRANEDAMTRSENANIIGTLDRKAKERADQSAAKNKIVGGTPEMEVADKKTTSKLYADAIGGIASAESARRDKMLDSLETSRDKAFENEMKRMERRNDTYAALAANAANAAKGMMGGNTKDGFNNNLTRNAYINAWGLNGDWE